MNQSPVSLSIMSWRLKGIREGLNVFSIHVIHPLLYFLFTFNCSVFLHVFLTEKYTSLLFTLILTDARKHYKLVQLIYIDGV